MTLDELTMDEFYALRINQLAVALKQEHLARMEAERQLAELKALQDEHRATGCAKAGTTLDTQAE